MSEPSYRTSQEALWAGTFGTDYIARNAATDLIGHNETLFRKVLAAAGAPVGSVLELGANIGNNLQALHRIDPGMALHAVEINPVAAASIRAWGGASVEVASLLDYRPAAAAYDLVFTKGVLIHINPDGLPAVYDLMVQASRRFVMVCEYYNPSPVAVSYRGHEHALFKRDFAGEILDRHPGLRLVDYGFTYHRDPVAPLDDSTWFLMEKVAAS
jgi:pseudaminic acid biosynthesis-associated methylase